MSLSLASLLRIIMAAMIRKPLNDSSQKSSVTFGSPVKDRINGTSMWSDVSPRQGRRAGSDCVSLKLPGWSTGCCNWHPWGQPARQESWLQSGPLRLCQHYQPSFSTTAQETQQKHYHLAKSFSMKAASLCRMLHPCTPQESSEWIFSFKQRSIQLPINTQSFNFKP